MVDNHQWRHAVQSYLATNSFVDHLVGMVLDGLAASGEADRTIVVLWSDHGFHLGEKLRWAKRTLWRETTRVPLIFAGPGCVERGICRRPVGLIDVYPTLLDLCGLPPRDVLEGRSLRPLLEDPSSPWDRPALCTFGPNNHSLCDQRYHYIVYTDGSEELYDLRSDPHEFTNLIAVHGEGAIGSEPLARVVQRLRRSLPTTNADPVPGSAGSDSPLYGEGGNITLEEAMKRGASGTGKRQ
jgi:arylsulfatase A-like enzyme